MSLEFKTIQELESSAKSILTNAKDLVPYDKIVRITKNGNGYAFHDILGKLSTCTENEYIKFLKHLNK